MTTLLLNHLHQERAAMDAFLALLGREAEALIQSRFDELPVINALKTQLVDKITALEQERERQQQTAGYPLSREGGDAAAAAGGSDLQQVWRDLLARAAQARDHNHRNGILIHTHLDFVRQSINFLRAHGQSLYGPDGKHKVGLGNGQSLASG